MNKFTIQLQIRFFNSGDHADPTTKELFNFMNEKIRSTYELKGEYDSKVRDTFGQKKPRFVEFAYHSIPIDKIKIKKSSVKIDKQNRLTFEIKTSLNKEQVVYEYKTTPIDHGSPLHRDAVDVWYLNDDLEERGLINFEIVSIK